jgi:hypothetical protein
VLHLLGQAAVFGSMAVLFDIGVLRLLRSIRSCWPALPQGRASVHPYQRLAVQDAGMPHLSDQSAAQSSAEPPITIEGVEGGDEDVLAEKEAVLAGDGFAAAAVSNTSSLESLLLNDVWTGNQL